MAGDTRIERHLPAVLEGAMRGRLKDLTIGLDGRQQITIMVRTDFREQYHKLADEEVDIEIKKHRERRSRDANAYCWMLIGKIAESMTPPLSKEEVYRQMLEWYGQGGTVSIEERHVSKFKREFKYCDEIGSTMMNGKKFIHFRFWVGSSQYDTREMSLLIDGVVSEAKELGIDTDTPEMISRLKDEWVYQGMKG